MLNKYNSKHDFVSKLKSKLHNNYSVSVDFDFEPLTVSLSILNLLNNELIEHTLTRPEMLMLTNSKNKELIIKLIKDLNLRPNSSVEHKKWLSDERRKDKLIKPNKTKRTSVLT